MAEFEKAVAISPDDPVALTGMGYADAVTGRKAEAREVLARLNELSKREFVSAVWRAKVYAGLREKALRSDPRFADLLRRTNLQP
jgi:hypothetical protein